ncbi:hypothetical protein [Agarivorans sp. B2Z047]|nr:hypothetical protein [Agarivorans sp. B2Z047]UQN41858.1 hypothetical protein LQZ07_19080 [Agarivorans sp. B2Z047]
MPSVKLIHADPPLLVPMLAKVKLSLCAKLYSSINHCFKGELCQLEEGFT